MNEITTYNTGLTLQPKEITVNTVETAKMMGELVFSSGIFKAPSKAGAAMIMLKGYELGFPMTAAAEFIQVIEGTVGLTPRGALAIIHNHPDVIRSVEFKDLEQGGKYYGCECTIIRIKNGKDFPYTKRFTLDDAQKAQLVKPNSGWDKYPAQMCQWRALGFAADIACPDLLAGLTGLMKMPEVMNDQEAAAFNGTELKPEPVMEVLPPEEPQMTLSDLLAKYGAEKILTVNGGAMPRTNAECAEIAEKIESGQA